MNNIEKIKDKIKKLFALSGSPNANEAAAALQMAQELMERYNIGMESVSRLDIGKEKLKSNGGESPSKYETVLTVFVAKAFGCRAAHGIVKTKVRLHYGWTFIGIEHRVKIAAFMEEVLLRKLRSARAKYMKSLTRVKSRGNKMRRADEFCMGWVMTVIGKLREFTNSPEEETVIERAVMESGWGGSVKPIDRKPPKRNGWNDYCNGKNAAASIELRHGVEGAESGARLLRGTV
ncbi:MAG: DUF2786 domain-containing protein [Treponema sp.]|nr:DUF2786 domain-containing protein [Treponema sp.]